MSDPTIVAVVMLAGVFLMLSLTIVRYGVSEAAKLWNLMGALTGVGFGAIITYYFADKSHTQEVRALESGLQTSQLALHSALQARQEIDTVSSTLSQAGGLNDEQRRALRFSIDNAAQRFQSVENVYQSQELFLQQLRQRATE